MSGVLVIFGVLGVAGIMLALVARALREDPTELEDPEPAIGLSQWDLMLLDHGDPAELEFEAPAFDWPESGQGYTLDSVLTLRNGGESNPAAGRSGRDQQK